MVTIAGVHPRVILDSRGNQTLEVDVRLTNGAVGRASVPAGASTGEHEAFKLDDMARALANVTQISPQLIGQDPVAQERVDLQMLALDGTPTKSALGANVLLALSLAICDAGAKAKGVALHDHIHEIAGLSRGQALPTPMFNIINGGKHADNNLPFQEFMVVPLLEGSPYHEKLLLGARVFHTLRDVLLQMGHTVAVGDEGGFAPRLNSNEEALEVILQALETAKVQTGHDVVIAIDVAASAIPDLSPVTYPASPHEYYERLVRDYPVRFLEDPLPEDDWAGWAKLTASIGSSIYVVGDDLYTTNPARLKQGIEQRATNAIIVKPDQIGTLTETFQTLRLAEQANMTTIISHRSGETESSFIADLAVGVGAPFIKTGAPSRGERVAKYNQLLRIEEHLQQGSS